MLKALIKSRISAMLASMAQSGKGKNKKKMATGLLIALFAFLVLYFLFAMGAMSYGICLIAQETGDKYASFTIATLASSAICLFGSIFATKTQIFESKDNELLLSMPIPPKYIFISRMIALLIINYLLEAIIMLPCMVMYGIVIGYSVLGFVFALIVFLLIPFLTLAISCIIAWIISEIASRLRNKTLVTVVLFIAFFGAYIYMCGSIGVYVGSEDTVVDLSGLKNTALFYWAGSAIADGNVLSLLLFTLCAIIPAVLVYFVLDNRFIYIITTKKSKIKVEYKGNREKATSTYKSLVKKEIRRFFSSSAYIMNAGLGNVLCLIFAIFISVSSKDFISEIGVDYETLKPFIPFVVSCICVFMGSMNLVSTPSISLEGKSLWILQSAPINPRDILMAKLSCHFIICTPLTVISAIILCINFKVSVAYSLLVILAVLSSVAFTGYWGLFLGLKFPKFDWQNENVAVKQGFAVFGSMLGSMLFFMILMGIGALLTAISIALGLLVIIVPLLISCAVIHNYLVNGGCVAFENLKNR